MKTANNVDDDSDDEEELYLQGTLIPRTPATLSIILEPPPPRRSTQGQGIRDWLYYLHKHKLVINLRSFWTRFFFCLFIVLSKRDPKIGIQELTQTNTKMSPTIMNSENSKTSDAYRLRFNLVVYKMDLWRGDKQAALSELRIYCTWKNIKKYRNKKFEMSGKTWDEDFELPDGSYSMSDNQN